jgi:hypothetical protein
MKASHTIGAPREGAMRRATPNPEVFTTLKEEV